MADMVTCPHCGRVVEAATFCSECGRPLEAEPNPVAAVPPIESPPRRQSATARLVERLRGFAGRFGLASLLPSPGPEHFDDYRWAGGFGLALVLLMLLAGNAGLAIAIAVFIAPVLFVMYLRDVDVFEDEPWLYLLLVVLGGFVAGLVIALVNVTLVDEFWLEDTPNFFNVGAAGFGGRYADAEGVPPVGLLLLSGLLIPIVAQALAIAAPVALRRWPAFRNEVMDGLTFGAAAGGGFAAAGAIVYYWPLVRDRHVDAGGVSTWTATLLGILVVRPLILSIATAMIGAGVWRFWQTGNRADAIFPVGAGLVGAVLYALGDLLIQPSGAVSELIWGVLVLGGGAIVLRPVLRRALELDRQAPAAGQVICPHCGSLTPPGAFCAVCGQPLAAATAPMPSPEPAPPAEPEPASEQEPEPWEMTEPLPEPPEPEEPEPPIVTEDDRTER